LENNVLVSSDAGYSSGGNPLIIDGDGHYVEPTWVWDEYVPKSVQDRLFLERDEEGFGKSLVVDEFAVDFQMAALENWLSWGMGETFTPGGVREGNVRFRRFEEADPGGWDSKVRLATQDREHIDAAVVFPTFGLLAGGVADRDVAIAMARAVNRFGFEYCAVAPGELYTVAVLPTTFPEDAAAELRRCVEEYGFVAGVLRPNPLRNGRTLQDPSFEPLWAAAEELGVPLTIHNAAYADLAHAGADRATSFMLHHVTVHPVEAMLAFGQLFEARIFERHPRLRVGFMESTCGWAPFWLERLDEHVEQIGWTYNPRMDRSASDTFREHCVLGCEGEERMVPYVQEVLGEESVVWASDYPHFDTQPPFIDDMMNRSDMTESQRDGVMRRAALSFYGLSEQPIRDSHAARGGPAV
jgi:uncharacterized protein